ncbi:hypothetical protein [Pelagerythrobacter aerophilus]
MKLQTLAAVGVVVLAVLAGLGYLSFWWVLIPAFFAGSLSLSNGHHYAAVMEANRRGSVTLFPLLLTIYCGGYIFFAALVYWLTGLVG